MTVNNSQFMPSVCDAFLRNTITDTIVVRGKALINSALKVSLSQQEVRGGFGANLQFIYMHSKKLDVTLENCTFDEGYLALNSNTLIANGSQNIFYEETITLSAGAGVTTNAPVGNVYVQPTTGGPVTTVTPTGSNFTVSGGGNNTYNVMYRYAAAGVDNFTIDASAMPGSFELVLKAKVFMKNVGQTSTLEITIPSFQLDGSADLSFTATGVSTSKLIGAALSNTADNAYAYVRMIPFASTSIVYTALAASPGSVSLSATNTSQQLSVFALRGGQYAPVTVTNASGITYTSSDATKATVNSSGLVTRVAAGSAYVTIGYQGLTDTVAITVS